MSETRKSDFVGDVYGDWVVTGRAPAQNRKRAWFVCHQETKGTSVVLQTDLPLLGVEAGAAQVSIPGGIDPWLSDQSVPIPGTDLWTFDLSQGEPPLDENDEPTEGFEQLVGDIEIEGAEEFVADWVAPRVGSADLKAGPGECKHAVQILECLSCALLMGPKGQEAHEKYPQKPLSRQIAERVLEANGKLASLEGDPWEPYVDWSQGLDSQEAPSAPESAPEPQGDPSTGIGEFASEAATEAELDAAVPPQDPVRAAIRKLMGDLFDHKKDIESLQGQIAVLLESANLLMSEVDDAMHAAVLR